MAVQKLRANKSAAGTMFRLVRSPAIVLVAKQAGLDFVIFDMEHGPYTFELLTDAASLARAEGIDCFVRVSELSKGMVSRALDCGVTGIMVPMIKDAQEARAFARWAKYRPIGERGLGGWGAHTHYRDSGPEGLTFLEEENNRILTIAQIEDRQAIEKVDEIAAVEGIDALLVGPADLSHSFGITGEFDHPKLEKAIASVAEAALRHQKIFGLHGGADLLHQWMDRGCKLRMHSMDIEMLQEGMAKTAHLLR